MDDITLLTNHKKIRDYVQICLNVGMSRLVNAETRSYLAARHPAHGRAIRGRNWRFYSHSICKLLAC
jgi:hypothetical protein